jgi:hypothetical protein
VSFLVHDGITFQEIVERTCIISMGGYYEIRGKYNLSYVRVIVWYLDVQIQE